MWFLWKQRNRNYIKFISHGHSNQNLRWTLILQFMSREDIEPHILIDSLFLNMAHPSGNCTGNDHFKALILAHLSKSKCMCHTVQIMTMVLSNNELIITRKNTEAATPLYPYKCLGGNIVHCHSVILMCFVVDSVSQWAQTNRQFWVDLPLYLTYIVWWKVIFSGIIKKREL